MKDFMPKVNQEKKTVENVLATSAKAREAKNNDSNVINATAGSYYGEDGNLHVFSCVNKAFKNPNYNSDLTYSSIVGTNKFSSLVKSWVFGENYQDVYNEYQMSVIATPGGTGAITISMGTYLEKGEGVMLPKLMWPAYLQIAKNLGINVDTYNLYNNDNKLDLESIKKVACEQQAKYDKVFLVVNDPCHNPTGFCMTEEDYDGLILLLNDIAEKTKVILLLDIAYLDYTTNNTRKYFEKLKQLNDNVMTLFAFSASKSFGIYGLRVGALLQLTKCEIEKELFLSSTTYFARATWSNVSHFGMNIVENTLGNEVEKNNFIKELNKASDNLEKRANIIIGKLKQYNVPIAPYENGFFVLLLISDKEFDSMLEQEGHYGCRFGENYRIAISSINLEEASRLGDSIGKIYQKIKK